VTAQTGLRQLDLFGAPAAAKPVVNPDGSVKGSTVIYVPKSEAFEYAALATNPSRGCGHSCAYRSVPITTHQDRTEFNAGAILRPNYLANLRKDAALYQAAGNTLQILVAFITDPYHPGDTAATRTCLEIFNEFGQPFSILSKGGTRALRDIDLFRPDRDCYGATLTSLNDRLSRKWERNAPLPGDRIAALKAFHERGIFTWASLEPVFNAEASLAVVEATHSFVDQYKIGRMNYLNLPIDWREYTRRMIDLLHRLGAGHYVKRDLQQFLPRGYYNPMRVPQHHGGRAINAESPRTSYERAYRAYDEAFKEALIKEIVEAIAGEHRDRRQRDGHQGGREHRGAHRRAARDGEHEPGFRRASQAR
jgi:DNA repair photolyase